MKRTFLTKRREQVIFNHLEKYLFEVLEQEDCFRSFAECWSEIERVYDYPAARFWSPLEKARDWLQGLPLSVMFETYKIKCMFYKWNGMDYERDGGNYRDNDSIDGCYWEAMARILLAMSDDDSEVVKGGWYYSQGKTFNYGNIASCGKWLNCYGNPTYRIRLYTGEVFELVDDYGLDRMRVNCCCYRTRKEMRERV